MTPELGCNTGGESMDGYTTCIMMSPHGGYATAPRTVHALTKHHDSHAGLFACRRVVWYHAHDEHETAQHTHTCLTDVALWRLCVGPAAVGAHARHMAPTPMQGRMH